MADPITNADSANAIEAARAALVASKPRVSWQMYCACGLFRGIAHTDPGTHRAFTTNCPDCGGRDAETVKQTTGGTVDREHLRVALDALSSAHLAGIAEGERRERERVVRSLREEAAAVRGDGGDGRRLADLTETYADAFESGAHVEEPPDAE